MGHTRMWMMAAVACATVMLVASPARAEGEPVPFALQGSGSVGGWFTPNSSYRLVNDTNQIIRGGAHVGVRLPMSLALELEYEQGASSGSVFDYEAGADLTLRTVGARATYFIDVIPFVRPYVTAAVGGTFGSLSVRGGDSNLDANAAGLHVHAGAGIEVLSRGRVRFGGFHDYGYTYRTPLSFDGAGGDFGSDVDLGKLEGGGLTWRLGARVVIPL